MSISEQFNPTPTDELKDALHELDPILEKHFLAQKSRQESLRINRKDTSEWVHFGPIALEINSEPESALILKTQEGFGIICGSRLEFHLDDGGALQDTRHQLGRIARYADARNLQNEFPILSASTWPRLAALARRIIPGTTAPVATYFFNNGIAEGIIDRLDDFEQLNGRVTQPVTIDSLAMPTKKFIKNWLDQS